jgi:hypothetical protein
MTDETNDPVLTARLDAIAQRIVACEQKLKAVLNEGVVLHLVPSDADNDRTPPDDKVLQ